MTPRITASTPPSDWPLRLTMTEVSLVLPRSYKSLSRAVSAGRCWPPPVFTEDGVYQRPLRWDKDVLRRYIGGELARPTGYLRRVPRRLTAA